MQPVPGYAGPEDPVMTYYGDKLASENDFLAGVDEFLQELGEFLQAEGRNDPKLEMLENAYAAAQKSAGQLYQVLQTTLRGINAQLRPDMEEKLPPVGHVARQSALYMLGCYSCIRLSPRKVLFRAIDAERTRYLDFLMEELQMGRVTQDQVWDATQSLLQLEETIPIERTPPEVKHAQNRKKALVVPFAFAAGKWLGDEGIDFLKDIASEVGFL
jgi:hypothetical protein